MGRLSDYSFVRFLYKKTDVVSSFDYNINKPSLLSKQVVDSYGEYFSHISGIL
jgi:hypothetical protein